MCICSRCGKKYDEDEAREEFEFATDGWWDCLQVPLCLDCAIDAFENEDGEVYKEECEQCHKKFDKWEAETEFSSQHSDDAGAYLGMFDQILCVDCANDLYENHISEYYPSEDEI